MNRLKFYKCPICGKKPKMSTFGFNTTITCKSLIGRPHLKTTTNSVSIFSRKKTAIIAWNQAVLNYISSRTTKTERET